MSAPVVIRTKAELETSLAERRRGGASVGLVPTMGSLHDGHAALLHAARAANDVVVMSLFVNPKQFAPGEDLDAYPRDECADLEIATACGVDVVYAPSVEEVYPDGFATTVQVDESLTGVLCGAPEHRGPGHFRGVTTVVAKLLSSVDPDRAYFGQKDAQQAVIVTRMAHDLDFRSEIVVVPTVREPDGLAMSSRNVYLDPDERVRALAISRALAAVERDAVAGAAEVSAALEPARAELRSQGIEPEYLEARYADDLTPAVNFNGRPVLVAVAARVGKARLIDNVIIGTV
ncbi:pantoate--beta-alanine ligase [soil metagenome]